MNTTDATELNEAFHALTLPKAEWTHEAHLTVCWYALQTMTSTRAVPYLRQAIRAYNKATGTPNTDTSGYHETLTRYYVTAVESLGASKPDTIHTAAECSRTAPLKHWTHKLLFSTQARKQCVQPDLEPLPWHPTERSPR